ncbi:MAG: hypothetical protein AB7G68_08170 [Nitrospiraceae bacterium]
MLRVTVQERQPARIVLEGTLAGPWVEETRQVWQRFQQKGGRLIVDLTEVSHIDWEGKLLLAAMSREGADLQASGCYIKAVLQEIKGSQEEK